LLAAGLLALAGCGGGGGAATRSASRTPTGRGAAHSATAASMGRATAIAAAAAGVASGVGDPVLASAVLAVAATPTTSATAATGGTPTAPAASVTPTTATHTTSTAPAPVPTQVIKSSATGQYAVAHINGSFRHPSQIVLKVDASPAQKGSVFWTIVCSEISGGVGHGQAQTTMQLPTSATLPIPAPSKYCIASANVQLSNSGKVTISISG
jgi:hypothetical protein